jgi:hypothetical protein
MNEPIPPPIAVKPCHECGAENEARARSCWLCHADLTRAEQPILAELVKPVQKPEWAPSEHTELIVVAAVGLLLILMGIGIYSVSEGGVILYAIFTIPAMLMTAVRASLKRARGEKITAADAVLTFFYTGLTVLLSGAAVIGLLALIAIAIVIGLIITCFASLGQWNFRA